MKFLSFEVTLHFYKSTIRPCLEYCCRFWNGATEKLLALLLMILLYFWLIVEMWPVWVFRKHKT